MTTVNATFPASRKPLFRFVTVILSLVLGIGFILVIVGRFISVGFDFGKTFSHLSLAMCLLILFVGIPLFSGFMGFLISQWMRALTITLYHDRITGRNAWGRKRTIPLSGITELTRDSSHGLKWIEVNGKHHGTICISDYTERLDELLGHLAPYAKLEETEKE
jgi:hypothetical protein